MNDNYTKKRHLEALLPKQDKRKLVLLTGARQTGKTTLTKAYYKKLPYFNFDAPEIRAQMGAISAQAWSTTVGNAVIDEAQKQPNVFEKIKYAYDDQSIDFTVLLGSSQILLLKKIRESLAGRISIFELFPLTFSEIHANNNLEPPLFDKLITSSDIAGCLENVPSTLFKDHALECQQAQNHLLRWGGMPALLSLHENERDKWLKDYEYTYLERDLADLVRLSDLEPFRLFQKLAGLRSAQLLNYSELARDSGVSVDTARRYLEYLTLSYQVVLLQPYYQNTSRSLVKTPKLYWLDLGILRQLIGFFGDADGNFFETMVVSECIKWIRTYQRRTETYFYRSHSGLEVDMILQTPHGIIGIEIKNRKQYFDKDTKPLRTIAEDFGNKWLGGILVYNGEIIKKVCEPNIWMIPAKRLFTA